MTEEFLGLGQRITKCQTGEFRADCLTRNYRAKVVDTCHCVPFTLRSHFTDKVGRGDVGRELDNKTSNQMRTCSSEDLVCVERLSAWERGDHGECLERCEGTIVDVTKLDRVREETVMDSFIREYQRYKHSLSDNIRQGNLIYDN